MKDLRKSKMNETTNDYEYSPVWTAHGDKVSPLGPTCPGMPRGAKLYSEKLGVTIIVCSHNSGGRNQQLAKDLMEMVEIELDLDRKKAEYLARFPEEKE